MQARKCWIPSVLLFVTLMFLGGAYEKAEAGPASIRRCVLQVKELTSEAGVAAVQEALLDVQGVQSAEVRLDKQEAVVDYDESQTSVERLVEAVQRTGQYTASVR